MRRTSLPFDINNYSAYLYKVSMKPIEVPLFSNLSDPQEEDPEFKDIITLGTLEHFTEMYEKAMANEELLSDYYHQLNHVHFLAKRNPKEFA